MHASALRTHPPATATATTATAPIDMQPQARQQHRHRYPRLLSSSILEQARGAKPQSSDCCTDAEVPVWGRYWGARSRPSTQRTWGVRRNGPRRGGGGLFGPHLFTSSLCITCTCKDFMRNHLWFFEFFFLVVMLCVCVCNAVLCYVMLRSAMLRFALLRFASLRSYGLPWPIRANRGLLCYMYRYEKKKALGFLCRKVEIARASVGGIISIALSFSPSFLLSYSPLFPILLSSRRTGHSTPSSAALTSSAGAWGHAKASHSRPR